ncbi:porin [Cereibacter sphaeroides]|nr:porin [Cereibacter sphaeroides]
MKNLLLASTVLVASATIANAQAVTISGEGRMGIYAVEAPFGWFWSQDHELTLDFNVVVEADHGLTFGAWTEAEMTSGWPGTAAPGVFSGSRVWVESNGLRLTFGNSDGAINSFGTAIGSCGVGYAGEGIAFSGLCLDQGLVPLFAHAEGDIAPQAMISYEGANYAIAVSNERGGSTEIAGQYTFGAITVAAGYSDVADGAFVVSGHYDAGSWGVGALYSAVDTGPFYVDGWALQGNVDVYGGTVNAYVGEVLAATTYGVSYGYGLGGGAELEAGVERAENGGVDVTTVSVGVNFSF